LASHDRPGQLQETPDSSPPSQSQRLASPVSGLDFVAVPSTDWPRSRTFYVETLGLRPDVTGKGEFWVGETCFGIYEPTTFGMDFAPQKTAHLALHVDDVAAARVDLEAKGVEFAGETFDTGVCHMAFFEDPDGNALMLHHRYAPREGSDL
jgi:catechol 2,3-dioxygenase-like lactoylglutathione lyase family enzyme